MQNAAFVTSLKAKKSFGQHFLHNEHLAHQIVDALDLSACRNVLEVGPGRGVLTKYLIEKDIRLKLVEADRDMVAYLKDHFALGEDMLLHADFLKTDLKSLFDGESFCIIGNFPYNISSQILIKIIEGHAMIPHVVGMFQREVAERILSPHGKKSYGTLSVLTQLFYIGGVVAHVSPGSFHPPPKVRSSVIWLKTITGRELSYDHRTFRMVVKLSFNQRRKMLRNSLKSLLHDEALLKHPWLNRRPEQMAVQDFVKLSNWIKNQ